MTRRSIQTSVSRVAGWTPIWGQDAHPGSRNKHRATTRKTIHTERAVGGATLDSRSWVTGGQANEAGSVFRRGVATCLAVHGLLERAVRAFDLGDGARPVALEFETGEATDDLTCRMSTGVSAFISAKRTTGNDKAFRDTVDSWVRQAGQMADGDLLVLATSELKGAVKELSGALDRRRRGLAGGASVLETSAMETLEGRLADQEPTARQRVLDAARVLIVPASGSGRLDPDALAGQLEGTLVASGHGERVLALLAAAFHDQAAAAGGSDLHAWVRLLRAGDIEVYPDLTGPVGARIAARQHSLQRYRRALHDDVGVVDLTLLADDLPELRVDDMLDSIAVKIDDERYPTLLSHVVRRWSRMVLFGLPGSGKSTALRELAGALAVAPDAPTPVPVNLRAFADRDPRQPLALHDLLEPAASRVPLDERPALIQGLTGLVESGDVILLCDGLDECGARAGWVGEQVKRIVSALPASTGLVLATRPSAASAASRFDVPTATVQTPEDLRATLTAVLEACAERRVEAAERAAWLDVRERWLDDARTGHGALLEVPLLTVLLTLVAAKANDNDLPRQRTVLLHRAVENSVRSWENRRDIAHRVGPGEQHPSGTMLLDGYVVLGTLLGSATSPSRADALKALATTFSGNSWRQAPAVAEETAQQVLAFWDEQVGVFVVGSNGVLFARSRVFAEVAEAMATRQMPHDELVTWVEDHLRYIESEAVLDLALGLNNQVLQALLDLGRSAEYPHATLELADALLDGEIKLQAARVEELVGQLADHARAAAAGHPTPVRVRRSPDTASALLDSALEPDAPSSPAWPYVQRLCLLSFPPSSSAFQARAQAITAMELPADLATVAAALVALGVAQHEDRPLTGDEVGAVQAALDLPLPPQGELIHESRRSVRFERSEPLISGLPTLARQAIRFLPQLADDSARAIYQIGRATTSLEAHGIQDDLVQAGVDVTAWNDELEHSKSLKNLLLRLNTIDELTLLEDIATLADPVELDRQHRWSLSAVSDLVAASGYLGTGIKDFEDALKKDTPELRQRWFRVLAKEYGIDPFVAAAQAQHVLNRQGTENLWDLITTRSPRKLVPREGVQLGRRDYDTLVDCMTANSSWIASSATMMLAINPQPGLSQKLMALLPSGRHIRDRTIVLAAVIVAENREKAAAALVDAPEFAYRAGAARALALCQATEGTAHATLDRFAADDDLTVRREVKGRTGNQASAPASYWSCSLCGQANQLTEPECGGCERGSIPVDRPSGLLARSSKRNATDA